MRRAITREANVVFNTYADSQNFYTSCHGYLILRGRTCQVRCCISRKGFLEWQGRKYPNSQCFSVMDVEATVSESEIEKAVSRHMQELQINDENFL